MFGAALVPESQSGRHADPLPRAGQSHATAFENWTKFGQTLISQRISMIEALAQVRSMAARNRRAPATRPAETFLPAASRSTTVQAAVQDGNVKPSNRHLVRPVRAPFTVQADGQLMTARQVRGPDCGVPQRRAGARSRTSARRATAWRTTKVAAWFINSNLTTRAIVLAVQRQPGMNTVAGREGREETAAIPCKATAAIRHALGAVRTAHPDPALRRRRAVSTLLLTLGLVVVVIFIFLRSFTATVIPSLALPMSIIARSRP